MERIICLGNDTIFKLDKVVLGKKNWIINDLCDRSLAASHAVLALWEKIEEHKAAEVSSGIQLSYL